MESLYLSNIPRLWTATAEWLACVVMILQLPNRKIRRPVWLYLSFFGLGQVFLQWFAGKLALIFWIIGMLINILWMFITVSVCEKSTWQVKIYHTSKAFIYAEFVASISWQSFCYVDLYLNQQIHYIIRPIFLIITNLLLFFIIYYLQKIKSNQYAILNVNSKSALNSVLVGIIIFTVSNMRFFIKANNPVLNNSNAVFMMRTFVDLCGILLFNLQENQRYEQYLHNDLIQMNSMFQSQYEQYQAYRESAETVNLRFHDLKQQLDIIALENNSKKRLDYINSLQAEIKEFKANIKTGNSIVDVVLTRKNAYCIKNDITFTCIANGKLLNQIDTMDICSLLGNSLDNAIEAVMKIPDKQKRLIDLRIFKKANFVIYSIRNFNMIAPKFKSDGLPSTTKKETKTHGYGLKSIQYIAEKYDGTLTLTNKNDWFSLTLIVPYQYLSTNMD